MAVTVWLFRSDRPVQFPSGLSLETKGLAWSDRGQTFLITEPLGENPVYKLDFRAQMSVWHERLIDAGLPRDLRFENASLDGLKLLVTPLMPHVSDAFSERDKTFVERGAIVMLGAQPQGDEGAALLTILLAHYATQAGANRIAASKGTLVCPRVAKDGRVLWLAVNLDGKGVRSNFRVPPRMGFPARPSPPAR